MVHSNKLLCIQWAGLKKPGLLCTLVIPSRGLSSIHPWEQLWVPLSLKGHRYIETHSTERRWWEDPKMSRTGEGITVCGLDRRRSTEFPELSSSDWSWLIVIRKRAYICPLWPNGKGFEWRTKHLLVFWFKAGRVLFLTFAEGLSLGSFKKWRGWGQHCSIVGWAAAHVSGIPYEHLFKSQHATHVRDLSEAPGLALVQP